MSRALAGDVSLEGSQRIPRRAARGWQRDSVTCRAILAHLCVLTSAAQSPARPKANSDLICILQPATCCMPPASCRSLNTEFPARRGAHNPRKPLEASQGKKQREAEAVLDNAAMPKPCTRYHAPLLVHTSPPPPVPCPRLLRPDIALLCIGTRLRLPRTQAHLFR